MIWLFVDDHDLDSRLEKAKELIESLPPQNKAILRAFFDLGYLYSPIALTLTIRPRALSLSPSLSSSLTLTSPLPHSL